MTMERKSTNTTVVTAKEVSQGLTKTKDISSLDANILRMRHGARVASGARLESAAGDNMALADELLVLELQLAKAARARLQAQRPRAARNPTREKIVRALKAVR